MRTEREWLADLRLRLSQRDVVGSEFLARQALAAFPQSADLARLHAGTLQQLGRGDEARSALERLLARDPADAASAFALAQSLIAESRTAEAARVLRAACTHPPRVGDAELAIHAIERLADILRIADAWAVVQAALAIRPADARLHAHAGTLALQLGDFAAARTHLVYALDHDARAAEWHLPLALSTTVRYADAAHPDIARYEELLRTEPVSDLARAELHFALGKACDDIGDYARAATNLRNGNAVMHAQVRWSRKAWRRAIGPRLTTPLRGRRAPPTKGFTPIFIVGMPRSGTTLLATQLARHPAVCNRGELRLLGAMATEPALAGRPDISALEDAARRYAIATREDDAPDARWFIDKQPLNFRYVDLALALFPDARILHCARSMRDTALSLWMQCFLEPVQGYSYAFDDIAVVQRDERKLMDRWRELFPDAIRDVRYEDLTAHPEATLDEIGAWIGLPSADPAPAATGVISSASLWQARQPIHVRSIGRWRHYVESVPELANIPDP